MTGTVKMASEKDRCVLPAQHGNQFSISSRDFVPNPEKLLKKFHQNFISKSHIRAIFVCNVKVFVKPECSSGRSHEDFLKIDFRARSMINIEWNRRIG